MKTINQTYGLFILTCIICLFTMSCSGQQKTTMEKNKKGDLATNEGTYIISVPVVIKNYVNKNGEITEQKEIYIQRSIQDYFIKFCESRISQEDLENRLSKIDDIFKTLTLEVEFLDGNWDSCNDNFKQQSRIGKYVIIHKIIN